jgi:hypothetical protein
MIKHYLDQLGYNISLIVSWVDMAMVVSIAYIPGECLRYSVRVLSRNDGLTFWIFE